MAPEVASSNLNALAIPRNPEVCGPESALAESRGVWRRRTASQIPVWLQIRGTKRPVKDSLCSRCRARLTMCGLKPDQFLYTAAEGRHLPIQVPNFGTANVAWPPRLREGAASRPGRGVDRTAGNRSWWPVQIKTDLAPPSGSLRLPLMPVNRHVPRQTVRSSRPTSMRRQQQIPYNVTFTISTQRTLAPNVTTPGRYAPCKVK